MKRPWKDCVVGEANQKRKSDRRTHSGVALIGREKLSEREVGYMLHGCSYPHRSHHYSHCVTTFQYFQFNAEYTAAKRTRKQAGSQHADRILKYPVEITA